MAHHNHFGRQGEDLAEEFLRSHRYEILKRNYRYRKAEVDIIARKGNTLIVVEVKARNAGHLKEIAETVTANKIALLVMTTDHYINEMNLDIEVRFDIITVEKRADQYILEHIKDAFYYF